MNNLKKWSVLFGALLIMCISACGKSTAEFISSEEFSKEETEDSQVSSEGLHTEHTNVQTMICVYVCGQVKSPGVYELPSGSRVCDAFLKAGGFTELAAKDYWNQARVLNDGEMIYVPTLEEAAEREPAWNESENTDDKDGKININTANKEQLMTIPGIGESKAESIIEYREKNGVFSSLEEVMQVDGIKEGLYEKMKDYIVIN